MPNLPPAPESDDAPTPRWVKLLGIAAVVFVLAFTALHLAGHGLVLLVATALSIFKPRGMTRRGRRARRVQASA